MRRELKRPENGKRAADGANVMKREVRTADDFFTFPSHLLNGSTHLFSLSQNNIQLYLKIEAMYYIWHGSSPVLIVFLS